MTDNSHALKRSRRRDSQAKRRRASETLQAMVDAGEPVTFPAVARRALLTEQHQEFRLFNR